MAVLINSKICDNASECSGIAACPTGAIFWDDGKGAIAIDNELCISCHACEGECPVGAIEVAETKDEYQDILKSIDEDKRKAEDLFVERYGAMPIDETRLIDTLPNPMDGLVFVEEFCDDSIQCLLHSIPVSIVIDKYNCSYYKKQTSREPSECPCLLIFRNGTQIGEVIGYYNDEEMGMLFAKIDKILEEEK